MVNEVYFTIFLAFHLLALITFVLGIYLNVSIWAKGNLPGVKDHKLIALLKVILSIIFGRHILEVVKMLILDVILQRRIFHQDKVRWLMHTLIIIGFLGLLLIVEPLSIIYHGTEFGEIYPQGIISEFFGVLLLLGILIAVFRRFVFKAKQLRSGLDDTTSLLLIFIVVTTGFIVEAVRFIDMAPTLDVIYSFFGYWLSGLIASSWAIYHDDLWLVHALISSAFLAYIPFSKFFHTIATPITILIGSYEEEHGRVM